MKAHLWLWVGLGCLGCGQLLDANDEHAQPSPGQQAPGQQAPGQQASGQPGASQSPTLECATSTPVEDGEVIACDLPEAAVVYGDAQAVYVTVFADKERLAPWIDARTEGDSPTTPTAGALLQIDRETGTKRVLYMWSANHLKAKSAEDLRSHVALVGQGVGAPPFVVVSAREVDLDDPTEPGDDDARELRWLAVETGKTGHLVGNADPGFLLRDAETLLWHDRGVDAESAAFYSWNFVNDGPDSQPRTIAHANGRFVGVSRGEVTIADESDSLFSYRYNDGVTLTWGLAGECGETAWVEQEEAAWGEWESRIVCSMNDGDGYKLLRLGDVVGEQIVGRELAKGAGRGRVQGIRRHEGTYFIKDDAGMALAAELPTSIPVLDRPGWAALHLPVPVHAPGKNGKEQLASAYVVKDSRTSAVVVFDAP